ncbi:MAG TPA: hypothetical protein VNM69_10495 [Bacillus sp. (in: firmicutes)]|uniref:hypothetical protein n=1 Tax=Bacillus litorisediminis TaxID=2922713 RepID=UPI001FAE4923|nr:hypothetical protein [Bacillus litorisediminis]HWO76309.1 hypothetical protein [Bacillus sp. (in: firmicutes)]
MRWLVKRPPRHIFMNETEEVIKILSLERFIWVDIFFYSLFFCMLLSPFLPTILALILTFVFIFGFGSSLFLTCKWIVSAKEES